MKICLDAGHYGKYNQSPCNKAYYESDMVWKLHLMLKKYLEEYGIEVITTRTTQAVDRELYSRGAASAGCNLFLSLHSNAVGAGINNQIDYPVAYCAIDGSADAIGTRLVKCIEDVMQTRQLSRIEHRKGQHGDYYGVVRGATAVGVPGLILEHSFHTNAEATEWLLNDTNLDRLAKAEANTIALYYGIALPTPKPEIPVLKSGWKQEDGGTRFYLGNTGEPVKNDWLNDDGKWYWFDGAGNMVVNTWYLYQGHWYYLGADGAMVKGLQNLEGKWYYLDAEGRMATEPVLLTPDQDGALCIERGWGAGYRNLSGGYMIILTHYNDGKEKWQSHEVSMKEKIDYGLNDFDFSTIYGYGETYEEALEEFKNTFSKKMEQLKEFEKLLFKSDLSPIEVDCCGKPI